MDLGIAGRTAIVAASTGGLGEATARALAAEGVRVAISGRREDRARAIAAELEGATAIAVDITTPDGPRQLVEQATEALGDIDIVVLNGPGPRAAAAADITSEDVGGAVNALITTHQRILALTLPGMRRRKWGRILAIGSSGVAAPIANLALSNLARSGLAAYLKTLATEVAADGVAVNLLLPGRIATERTAALDTAAAQRAGRSINDVVAQSLALIPVGRYGDPEEFGAAAAFLCSTHASYITGTALRCDGGLIKSL